jgi:alcohol dehydrogenase (cytochrome c)
MEEVMRIAFLGSACTAAVIVVALTGTLAVPASAAPATPDLVNVDQEPANWLHHHRTYDGHRFSPLSQIDKTNVKDLELKIMVGLDGIIGPDGATRLEATPLAEDGFLYVTDGFNNAYKIDVRNGQAGYVVWKWDPGMDRAYAFASGCCQRKNRGLAMIGDLVVQNTQDGRTVGINKDSGEAVWEVVTANNDLMESHTGAPLAYNNLVLNGVTGAEMGIRGHLDAVNVETGQIEWTTYIVPGPGEAGELERFGGMLGRGQDAERHLAGPRIEFFGANKSQIGIHRRRRLPHNRRIHALGLHRIGDFRDGGQERARAFDVRFQGLPMPALGQ